MKIKTIIVDDEPKSRSALKSLLTAYCPQVEIVALAEDVLSGVKFIHQYSPDLVFIDIQMPNYSGFKLVEYFEHLDFYIVFTTAHEQYALQAYRAGAVGYLLKPIDIDDLMKIVNRIAGIISRKNQSMLGEGVLIEDIAPDQKTSLPTKNGIIYFTVDETLYLKAEGRDTFIFFKNGTYALATVSMKECQQKFFKTTLMRIHKSHMVNLKYVNKYVKKVDAYVELEGGIRLDVGHSFKNQLNKGLGLFSR